MKTTLAIATLITLTACSGPSLPKPGDTYAQTGQADPWCKNTRYLVIDYRGRYPESYVLLENQSTGEQTTHRAVYFVGWPKLYERDPVPCIKQ